MQESGEVSCPDVSFTGYAFVAWNTVPDGSGTAYYPGNTVIITQDLFLYAQWQFITVPFFSVAYNPNGGDGGHTDYGLTQGSSYTVLTEEGANVDLDFFSLVSWNTESDGSGMTYLPRTQITIEDDMLLYAQWEFTG